MVICRCSDFHESKVLVGADSHRYVATAKTRAAELHADHFRKGVLGHAFPNLQSHVLLNFAQADALHAEEICDPIIRQDTFCRKQPSESTDNMVGQSPSIQSFFPLQSSPLKTSPRLSSPAPGDGFTSEELDTSLTTAQKDDWIPSADYDEYDIDSLVPGPNRIKLVGRVVNLFESSPKAKLPTGAKGSIHLVVKDNTGAVTVSLPPSCSHKLVLNC